MYVEGLKRISGQIKNEIGVSARVRPASFLVEKESQKSITIIARITNTLHSDIYNEYQIN